MKKHHKNKEARSSVFITLLPVMTAVLVGFIIIGVALPVLPIHIKSNLGYGAFIVGVVASAQFLFALVSRIWSGAYSDTKGAKKAVIVGLIAASVAGLLYLVSVWFLNIPKLSLIILLLGRAILGGAESFVITGGIAWGLAIVSKEHSGKVIAWVGTAMFTAMALGGPIGIYLFNLFGFGAIALLTLLLPLVVLVYLFYLPSLKPMPHSSTGSLISAMKGVWLPGVGAALASLGYFTILAFSSLYYSSMGWQPVWMAFTAFGVALIITRMFVGDLPDRFGGAHIALLFVIIQSIGLFMMWCATSSFIASIGSVFVGVGYSLVYPGLGLEAVNSVSPQNRGMAMGIFTAFLDIAMAIGGPIFGWIGGTFGIGTIFLAGSGIVLCTAIVTILLIKHSAKLILVRE